MYSYTAANPVAATQDATYEVTCAEEQRYFEGTAGTINWVYDAFDYTLTVSGTGAIPAYADQTAQPWAEVSQKAKHVVVKTGITEVGAKAFTRMAALESITFESGVATFGADTMSYCSKLTTVVFGGPVKTIGQGIVYSSSSVKNVTITGQTYDEFNTVASAKPYNTSLSRDTNIFTYADPVEYTVTWKNGGEVIGTSQTIKGFAPVVPEIKDGYYIYVPKSEITDIVLADCEFDVEFTQIDTRVITLGKYGTGIENWSGNTQFLLRIFDYNGADLNLEAVKANYDFVLTINGKEYTGLKPVTYAGIAINRFTPCAAGNEVFVPLCVQGTEYVIGLNVYKTGTDELAYYSTNTTTLVVPENFVPIHEHNNSVVINAEPTCTEAGSKTLTCSVCGNVVTETIAALGHNYVNGECTVCGLKNGETFEDGKYYYYVEDEKQSGWFNGNYYLIATYEKVMQTKTIAGRIYDYDSENNCLVAINGVRDNKFYVNGIAGEGWHDGNYYRSTTKEKVTETSFLTKDGNRSLYEYDAENDCLVLLSGTFEGYLYDEGKVFSGEHENKYYVCGRSVSGWYEGNYYLYSTGIKVTEDKVIGGKQYIYSEEQLTLANGFVTDEAGTKCYVDGVAVYGWVSSDGTPIEADSQAEIVGAYYFYFTSKYMFTGEKLTVGGIDRTFDENHLVEEIFTGFIGNKYYLEGVMQTGWVKVDGEWYYLMKSDRASAGLTIGDAAYGWIKIGGKAYYFDTTTRTLVTTSASYIEYQGESRLTIINQGATGADFYVINAPATL